MLKNTRRTLFGMLMGLFVGWGMTKPLAEHETWVRAGGKGKWVKITYTVTVPSGGPNETYDLLTTNRFTGRLNASHKEG